MQGSNDYGRQAGRAQRSSRRTYAQDMQAAQQQAGYGERDLAYAKALDDAQRARADREVAQQQYASSQASSSLIYGSQERNPYMPPSSVRTAQTVQPTSADMTTQMGQVSGARQSDPVMEGRYPSTVHDPSLSQAIPRVNDTARSYNGTYAGDFARTDAARQGAADSAMSRVQTVNPVSYRDEYAAGYRADDGYADDYRADDGYADDYRSENDYMDDYRSDDDYNAGYRSDDDWYGDEYDGYIDEDERRIRREERREAAAQQRELVGESDGRIRQILLAWGVTTVLCLVFSWIYAQFSHGVSSVYMTYLFVVPLVGGVVIPGVTRLLNQVVPGRVAWNAYNSGIAALTVATALHGIFDIAGTSSGLVAVLAYIGVAFVVAAVAIALISSFRDDRTYVRA